MKIDKIANRLVQKLKAKGFTIQVYHSMSTKSIYIKLDYGLCNSIRVSDHPGKKYLDYRFNLMTGIQEAYSEKSPRGFQRFYYPVRDLDTLMEDILQLRETRLKTYGAKMYGIYMLRNKSDKRNSKGFWSMCREV